jgi:hypothetical protein
MKDEYGKCNPKKTKKKQPANNNVKSFFDGTTFSNGKGIGSKMLEKLFLLLETRGCRG